MKLANAVARVAAQQGVPRALFRSGGRQPTGELKDITTTGATSLTLFNSGAGQLILLNGVARGAAATERVGRQIKMKSIYLRYVCYPAPTSAGASPVRVMIVYDKQTNTVAPTALEILTVDNVYSPNQLANSRRFVTLMDRVLAISTLGEAVGTIEFYKKMNLDTQFNAVGNTGTVTDIQSGSIYMFVWGTAGIQTASLLGGWTARIRFED